jgi:hypothetical protein
MDRVDHHSKVEGVSSDDLMRVWRGSLAGVDQRISSFDGELRACEAKHVLRKDALRQQRASDDGRPDHDDNSTTNSLRVVVTTKLKSQRLLKSSCRCDVHSMLKAAISHYIGCDSNNTSSPTHTNESVDTSAVVHLVTFILRGSCGECSAPSFG